MELGGGRRRPGWGVRVGRSRSGLNQRDKYKRFKIKPKQSKCSVHKNQLYAFDLIFFFNLILFTDFELMLLLNDMTCQSPSVLFSHTQIYINTHTNILNTHSQTHTNIVLCMYLHYIQTFRQLDKIIHTHTQ